MPLNIFETDPEAAPRPKQNFEGPDFNLRSGYATKDVKGNTQPHSLEEWRVTANTVQTAQAIAELYGGTPQEWDTPKADAMEVYTSAKKINVVFSGPSGIRSRLQLWVNRKLVHECDGVTFLADPPGRPESKGDPCGCPKTLAARKEAAEGGFGPSPAVDMTFRLADDLDLGTGHFRSGSWTLLESLFTAEPALARVGAEALGSLELEVVEYDTKAGRHVKYTKPVVSIAGPFTDAIADDNIPF